MAILPTDASRRAHELSGAEWKVYTNFLSHLNLITMDCEVSHETIARETGIEITNVSNIKRELVAKHWIIRRGRWAVSLLVGADELARVRAKRVADIEAREGAKFGRPQNEAPILEKFQDTLNKTDSDLGKIPRSESDLGIFHAESWKNSKIINKDDQVVDQVVEEVGSAPTTTAAATRSDDWKQGTVTQAFLDDIIARGLYSRQIVERAWRELSFKVAQRGPDARATKGELLAFCRQAQATTPLPGLGGAVVELTRARTPPDPSLDCDPTCPLCHGSQMQAVEGKGARRCPSRVARMAEVKREATSE